MKKMQITAYTDDSFNTLYKTMELPVSPGRVGRVPARRDQRLGGG